MSRLRDLYENEITKKMTDKFGYKNPMMVPKIDKIVINMGAVSYTHLTLPTKRIV